MHVGGLATNRADFESVTIAFACQLLVDANTAIFVPTSLGCITVADAAAASGTPDVSAVSRRLMQPLVSVTVSDPGGTATITASLQLSATRCACTRASLAAPVTPRAVSR